MAASMTSVELCVSTFLFLAFLQFGLSLTSLIHEIDCDLSPGCIKSLDYVNHTGKAFKHIFWDFCTSLLLVKYVCVCV